ncbi:Fungal specific transcription factor [Penicillium lagena]|uniref:Fungal specific transcription factor n=1 Tax=Penicillium lagena TaxID=94218 RepID=UPI002542698B|nr:Fungal specific transcription factor [Penicillium lagena]KAJ5611410.1 Fungal specific transcription factor [Penicillium lagena]
MSSSKRMRLGTKSCTECRRRKVRCIFRADESACEACLAHEADCVAQQAGGHEVPSDEVDTLKRRLRDLEAIVRKLPPNATPSPGSDFAGDDASVVRERDARGDLSSTTTLSHSPATTPFTVGGWPVPTAKRGGVKLSSTEPAIEDSPLILLFKGASLLDKENAPASTAPPPLPVSAVSGVLQHRHRLASLLPSTQDLDAILEDTEKYWPIWPRYYYGEPGATDFLGPGKGQLARQLLFTVAASSVEPGLIARSALWVALCVQQTSRSVLSIVSLAYSQYDLVDAYIRTAKSLLELDGERGGTLDGIESMNMLYKLSINIGRSQTAWYWCRQAITTAVSLGVPRKVDALDIRAAYAWSMAWQTERFMALMLGLPTSVSANHPGTSSYSPSAPLMSRIMCSVALICGKAIDRDQAHHAAASYATTVEIDQDMEEAYRLFPDEHWLPLAPDMSLSDCWNQQASKVIFFTTLKLVHMPCMLKSVGESKFLYSWDRAMEAARGAATAYSEFRTWPGASATLCELMDFQAFSAAMVLIIGHLIFPARATSLAKDQDWALVRDVSLCLRRTVAIMDCAVAAQSVRILDLVDAARHGAYIADDDYVVTIPYFGRIRINKKKVSVDNQNDSDNSRTSPRIGLSPVLPVDSLSTLTDTYFNTVEFSTMFAHENPSKLDFEMELCSSWADPALFNAEIDRTQTFNCGPFYPLQS